MEVSAALADPEKATTRLRATKEIEKFFMVIPLRENLCVSDAMDVM
jgi:hypothetical protein